MNTKNKIIAILMAGIVAMAVGIPMVMGGVPATASVNDVASTYDPDATTIAQPEPSLNNDGSVSYVLTVSDNNGADAIPDDVWKAEVTFTGGGDTTGVVSLVLDSSTDTTKTFKGIEEVPEETVQGIYTISFKNGTTEVVTKDVTVNGVSAVEIDFDGIAYGAIVPGGSGSSVPGDVIMDTVGEASATGVKPTVMNDGNFIDMDVSMSITDAGTNPEPLFAVNDNLGATVDTVTHSLSGTATNFNVNIGIDETVKIDSTLTAPAATKTGAYEATLTIEPDYVT